MSGCVRAVPSGLGLTHCHRLHPADDGMCYLLGWFRRCAQIDVFFGILDVIDG
jgi:hypothetical protein